MTCTRISKYRNSHQYYLEKNAYRVYMDGDWGRYWRKADKPVFINPSMGVQWRRKNNEFIPELI